MMKWTPSNGVSPLAKLIPWQQIDLKLSSSLVCSVTTLKNLPLFLGHQEAMLTSIVKTQAC